MVSSQHGDREKRETPRLGPWLRHYQELRRPKRLERLIEVGIGSAATVLFALILLLVVLAFRRFPWETVGALFGVWLIGFLVSLALRQRSRSRHLE